MSEATRVTPAHRLRFPHQAGWAAGLTVLFAIGLALPGIVFFSEPSQYTILHTILEFASMAISLMVVALAWNLRDLERNSQVMLIGWFSLGILLVDLAHTLSFPGMPPAGVRQHRAEGHHVLARRSHRRRRRASCCSPWSRPGTGTRGCGCPESSWSRRQPSPPSGSGCTTPQWVPTFFVPGDGLTTTKVVIEYALSAAYAVAALLLLLRARREHSAELAWLATAAWTLVLAELYFTLYVNVADVFNLLGPCAQGRRLHHGLPGDLRRRRAGSLPSARPRDLAAAIADRLRSRPHLLHRPGGPPPRGEPGVQLAVPRRARRRGRTQPRGRGVDRRPGAHPAPPAVGRERAVRGVGAGRRGRPAVLRHPPDAVLHRQGRAPRGHRGQSRRHRPASRGGADPPPRPTTTSSPGCPNRIMLGDSAAASFADPALAGQGSGAGVPRPRRLQDHQRHGRASGRRPADPGGRPAARRGRGRRCPRRAPRRRRVRGAGLAVEPGRGHGPRRAG